MASAASASDAATAAMSIAGCSSSSNDGGSGSVSSSGVQPVVAMLLARSPSRARQHVIWLKATAVPRNRTPSAAMCIVKPVGRSTAKKATMATAEAATAAVSAPRAKAAATLAAAGMAGAAKALENVCPAATMMYSRLRYNWLRWCIHGCVMSGCDSS